MTSRSPGADRNLMRGQRVRDAVAHDAAGQQCRRPDLDTARALGDKVGGDVADSDPAQCVGFEVDAGQCDCGSPSVGQAPMAQLQQHVEGLGAATVYDFLGAQRRGLGRLAVTQSVRHTE